MAPKPPKNELLERPWALYVWEIELPAGLRYFGPYVSREDAENDPETQLYRKNFAHRIIRYPGRH